MMCEQCGKDKDSALARATPPLPWVAPNPKWTRDPVLCRECCVTCLPGREWMKQTA